MPAESIYAPLALSTLLLFSSCSRDDQDLGKPSVAGDSVSQPATAASGSGGGQGEEARPKTEEENRREAYDRAKQLIDEAMQEEGLPGALGFEKHRAAMVARAKSEPVVFVRAPQATPAKPGVESLRAAFERTDFPWRELKKLRNRFYNRPELARQLLLKEGYLYSEDPNHAFTLVSQIKPRHLFGEERIWVHRGPWLMHAERGEEDDYFFLDGPEKGKKVRLLHLDRVGTGPVPEPLHRDFRSLRYRLFFERVRVKHITQDRIVAELRYDTHWVPTLLKSEGAKLELVAELIAPEEAEAVEAVRSRLERGVRAVSKLRDVMREQIDEGLPFDEPKTEEGQQDGTLRRLWRYAYLGGHDYFRFNGDRYQVFDDDGRPRVPQVCVDFMVDTFERASGNWWKDAAAEERGRSAGKLELSEFVENDQLRRTKGFLRFAREHDQWFEVLTFPKYMRVQLGYKRTFFRWLEKKVDHFAPGDIVFIRGLTPWDEVDEHSHSFFIYEIDPITGVPIAIAGNAGPANLWSWETEARRTPHRTVRDRVRPKLEWLESFLNIDREQLLDPPALVSGKK